MLGVAEVYEGVQVFRGFEDDVAAAAAIAAIRAAEFDMLFAAKGDDTIAAVTRANVDFGLVKKFHFLVGQELGADPVPQALRLYRASLL